MANAELHQIRSFFLSPESSDLSGSAVWRAGERESPQKKKKIKRKPQGEVKTLGTLEWPSFGEEERSWVEAHPLPHPALALLGFL